MQDRRTQQDYREKAMIWYETKLRNVRFSHSHCLLTNMTIEILRNNVPETLKLQKTSIPERLSGIVMMQQSQVSASCF